jgi:hypothetical protein
MSILSLCLAILLLPPQQGNQVTCSSSPELNFFNGNFSVEAIFRVPPGVG